MRNLRQGKCKICTFSGKEMQENAVFNIERKLKAERSKLVSNCFTKENKNQTRSCSGDYIDVRALVPDLVVFIFTRLPIQ
jgi:hypothetical protein